MRARINNLKRYWREVVSRLILAIILLFQTTRYKHYWLRLFSIIISNQCCSLLLFRMVWRRCSFLLLKLICKVHGGHHTTQLDGQLLDTLIRYLTSNFRMNCCEIELKVSFKMMLLIKFYIILALACLTAKQNCAPIECSHCKDPGFNRTSHLAFFWLIHHCLGERLFWKWCFGMYFKFLKKVTRDVFAPTKF